MRGFDSKFIEELKNKNDIVDVVSKYVPLEQRGGNFWGKCPFHHEKTASFAVNAAGQFYHCFGCHASGDVISFIMEIESLDFSDAVKLLADRAKMKLPEINIDDEKLREQKKKKETLLSILRETALYYVHNLKAPQAAAHVEYVLKRKFTAETVTAFGMGASLNFDGLVKHLYAKGYSYEDMLAAGVVGKSEKTDRYFDWLGGRLTIPVIDQFNNVIAFAGRRIDNVKEQKYINTKETQVFSKGKTLFNLNNLKKAKNEVGINGIIIVEGHLDVVSLQQAGFNNVVASMGTSLTKDQARILKRYSDKIYISYDGDFAGQKASVRGLEICKEEGLDVKVVALPDGKDPDDVVKVYGAEGYRQLLDNAMPLIDFKLDILKKTYDVNTVDGKRKYVSAAVKVISESDSPAEQEDLLKTVRDVTGTTYESLRRELLSYGEKREPVQIVAPSFDESAGDKSVRAGRFVLYCLLFGQPFASSEDIQDVEFANQTHREIAAYVFERSIGGLPLRFNDLYEILDGDSKEELSRIAEMKSDENKSFSEAVYYSDCIKSLKEESFDRKIKNLTAMASAETDINKRTLLLKEISRLMSEKKRLAEL